MLDARCCVTVDIMKRTEKSQPDHDNLRRAISALEEVTTYGHVSLTAFVSLKHFALSMFTVFNTENKKNMSFL